MFKLFGLALVAVIAGSMAPAGARDKASPGYESMDPEIVTELPSDVDLAPEAVKAACADRTKAGRPTIAYLACVRHVLSGQSAPSHGRR
ncbi:MAG: hypothetical protein P4L98_22970 [Ancalomicrobiaceae bacterium]|nr:hypothetical protein [Ancalomicrobiaceae bacterium]